MSRQYLTTHTIENAHLTDIFSLAATKSQLLSASGSSSINVYSTATSDFPLAQTLANAHPLGCHHIAVSRNGTRAASIGFEGQVKIWGSNGEDHTASWKEVMLIKDGNKPGALWALALSADAQYLASTTADGCVNVWALGPEAAESTDDIGHRNGVTASSPSKIRSFETKGSFGLAVAMSVDGLWTASGHASGAVYLFSNSTGRLAHALPGLVQPVRALAFSPHSTLLAAAGDARIIALYHVESGEQIAALKGHASWVMSLDFNATGELLLSGGWDGKVKVWSIDRLECVATHGEMEGKSLWSVVWLPKGGRVEEFAAAGAAKAISFYREAAGS